jgi:hypothetical protein
MGDFWSGNFLGSDKYFWNRLFINAWNFYLGVVQMSIQIKESPYVKGHRLSQYRNWFSGARDVGSCCALISTFERKDLIHVLQWIEFILANNLNLRGDGK